MLFDVHFVSAVAAVQSISVRCPVVPVLCNVHVITSPVVWEGGRSGRARVTIVHALLMQCQATIT